MRSIGIFIFKLLFFSELLEWDATELYGQVFSVPTPDEELPLPGMNTNACEYITSNHCPIQPSTKYTYSYTLPLGMHFNSFDEKPNQITHRIDFNWFRFFSQKIPSGKYLLNWFHFWMSKSMNRWTDSWWWKCKI